jgi:hydroxyacylglutathione hydrolase
MASDDTLLVEPLPAFDDNYIWLLRRAGQGTCAVVDPGDEDPVIARVAELGLALSAILITHKHGDHVGGVRALKRRWPGAVVYGPADEPVPERDVSLHGGERIEVAGLGDAFEVLAVPGHTEGHIAYLGGGRLFCGDTLFACGCGRVFSGTFEQLAAAMQRFAALPDDTRVYCAHEYTLVNMGFAKWVEPDNGALLAREAEATALRGRGEPTLPSTIGLERETNPFLRAAEPGVRAAAEHWAGRSLTSSTEVFTAIRQWKDRDYD